ncbi:MAG: biotin/lipoyl-containing protein [Pseudomonadota bacterium]
MSNESILRDVQTLATLFKAGGWKKLRVEFPGGSLLLSEDVATAALGGEVPFPGVPAPAATAPVTAPATASAPVVPAAQVAADGPVQPGWIAIRAPNLGTFYRSPKPGASPFVEIGQHVSAETEVCLLEVMKLFTSVKAGVTGTIKRVCAVDAQLVEGDTILFYIAAD